MSESNAVAVRKSTDVVALDELERALRTGEQVAEVEQPPSEVTAREIIVQLLEAESDAELERLEAESWSQEYLGVPMEVHSFAWRPSAFSEGQPVFLVVRTLDPDGEPHVLTIGAGQAMAQLVNLAKRDRLPIVRELRSNTTKAGNAVYFLATPDAIAEREKAARAAERSSSTSAAE